MGSKRFKGKLCAYCAADTAFTGDHVFCRELFPDGYRDGLPKAPACVPCNNTKSALERYLTAVLPFGSAHPAALSGQTGKVKRRLSKQPDTLAQLQRDKSMVWVKTNSGIHVPTLGLPFDGERFDEYLRLAVRGLVWHEWAVVVPPDYVVVVLTLDPEAFEAFSETVLKLGSAKRVYRTFAQGALNYNAANASDDSALSTWHIRLYENLGISSDGHEFLEIVGIVGPPQISVALDGLLRSGRDS